MKVRNGKREWPKQNKEAKEELWKIYMVFQPHTTDDRSQIEYVIIMVHRGPSLLTSADKRKKQKRKNIEGEPLVYKGRFMLTSQESGKACSIS